MAPPEIDDRSETGIAGKKIPFNPTPLSAPQEQQVRDIYYANVRLKCAPEIEAFAACARGRTLTMVWACRDQKIAMNSCMLQYQGQEEMDRARNEWFRKAGERKRAKQEMERKADEGRRKHREWWNLDEQGKLQGKKAEVSDAVVEGKR
ncbi:hypothetical protein BU24DRAFT_420696 [Aaosphaeria arxii CBS 175.79]|uniref:COX assembly mitochondrial protein n=1 Tax=Aaosphaeria arxii CBS 175.79 TaxID=1450172 RepID=A0A6A5XWF0_9PLEO|nr:uncharacterized protein BU24DRAFT_420696 [Aaosphaeria arxii CBS 175.79]KAF2017655.1 hypothetical protein BU24DRAFT_420696 [Aaosphaeria arxii CBS 175.79]